MIMSVSIGQINTAEPDVLQQIQELVKETDSKKFSIIPFFSSEGFKVRTEAKGDDVAYPKLYGENGTVLNVAIGEFNVYDYFVELHPTKSVFYSAGDNGEVIMFYSKERLRKLYDRFAANNKLK
jgi:hypothetical protein